MRRRVIAIASIVASAFAVLVSSSCSESTDGAVPPSVSSAVDGATTDTTPTVPNDSGAGRDVAVVTASSILVNEIAADDEWIELVGTGTTAIDISGYRVADSEKDGGAPKLSEAVTFPVGTIVSPKAYVIVQAGGLDGGGKACPDGGQSYCFKAEFGVSNKSGETIYLVDGSGAVVGSAIYPPKAAPAGDSWGRLPNADPNGAFAVTASTPGAANRAK